MNGIFFRKRHLGDMFPGLFNITFARADEVRLLPARISTHHLKVRRSFQAFVSHACRNHNHVSRCYPVFLSLYSAQNQPGLAFGNSQYLMIRAMIMVKGINPPPPSGSPVVSRELSFKPRRHIFIQSLPRHPYDYERKQRIVRRISIIDEKICYQFGLHGHEDARSARLHKMPRNPDPATFNSGQLLRR